MLELLQGSLGKRAMDKVTGFTGTMTGYTVYLDGGLWVRIERLACSGESIKEEWIEIGRVEISEDAPIG